MTGVAPAAARQFSVEEPMRDWGLRGAYQAASFLVTGVVGLSASSEDGVDFLKR
jgi:hypothetical protein